MVQGWAPQPLMNAGWILKNIGKTSTTTNLGKEVPKLGNVNQQILGVLEQAVQGGKELSLQVFVEKTRIKAQECERDQGQFPANYSPLQEGLLKAWRRWVHRSQLVPSQPSLSPSSTQPRQTLKIHYNVDISNNTELTMQLYSLQTSLRSLWLSRQDPKTEIHKITKISINPSLRNVCLSSLDASICVSPLYASTLREVVRPVFPPSLEKHWHPRSKAHLEPEEWQFKKNNLQWPLKKEKTNLIQHKPFEALPCLHFLVVSFLSAANTILVTRQNTKISFFKIQVKPEEGGGDPWQIATALTGPWNPAPASKDEMRSYS